MFLKNAQINVEPIGLGYGPVGSDRSSTYDYV